MKKICPKCKSVVYELVAPMGKEKGAPLGINPDYPAHIEEDKEGTFISCKSCGEKYRAIPMPMKEGDPFPYRIIGLCDSSD